MYFEDYLQYSPLNLPEDLSLRRDSCTDAGYYSNNSSIDSAINSPDNESIRLDAELKLPGNLSIEDPTMNFDNSGDIFSSLEKQTSENSILRSPPIANNRPNDFSMARRRSVAICNVRSNIKFSQSDNSAFSASKPRYNKSCDLADRSNGMKPPPNCTSGEGQKHNKLSQGTFHSSMQNSDAFHSPQNSSNSFYSQHTSNSYICNNRQTPNHGQLLATDAFLNSYSQSRPDPVRRQHSDSAVLHHYSRHDAINNAFSSFEPTNVMDKCTADVLDYSNQYMNTPGQKHANKSDYRDEPHLADFGLMDPSLLTISPNIKQEQTRQPDLPADDTMERFFRSSQGSFCSPPNAPACGETSIRSAVEASDFQPNSVGDSGPLGIPNSIGQAHVAPPDARYTTEDEAWRSYLENPLTAATTAMMSIQGDEDGAAALGLLYDYYKVPREKRILAYQANNAEQSNSQNRRPSVQDADSSGNGMLSDEVSILSPVSTVGSRGQSSVSNNHDSSLRDPTSEGVLSPIHAVSHVAMAHDDVTTLNTVRMDLGMNAESLSFGEYSKYQAQSSTRSQAKHRCSVSSSQNSTSNSNINNNNNDNPRVLLTTTPTGGQHIGSPVCSLANMFPPPIELLPSDYTGETFEYIMEAPKSLKQKEGEPTMSYINKGQFYCISLRECGGQSFRYKSSRVTSVVQIVFGDAKPEEEQLRHWKYWHARQHTAKQRIIDIADYKESCMISDIDEFAHNAIRFNWDIADVAKIFVSCNCLSTDFSAQKGIKGLPLLIQIDTYLDNRRSGPPDHRGVCQLKVFCDKGAERKIRDEERKAMRKRQKSGPKGANVGAQRVTLSPVDVKPIIRSPSVTPPPQNVTSAAGPNLSPQKRQDIVQFKTMTDCTIPAVYFVPEIYAHSGGMRNHVPISPCNRAPTDASYIGGMLTPTSGSELEQVFLTSQLECFDPVRGTGKRSQSMVSSEEGEYPPSKMPRVWEQDANKKVLLYIRKETDVVYDGVMLREPTLNGLKDALQEKYEIPSGRITKVLKKSQKGILVNVDDNIVRHYSNEDTFVIDFTSDGNDDDVTYEVTLTVV